MMMIPRWAVDWITGAPAEGPTPATPSAAPAAEPAPPPAPPILAEMPLEEQVTRFLAWMREDGHGTGWMIASRMRPQQIAWAATAGVDLAPETKFAKVLKGRPGVVFEHLRDGSRLADDELSELMRAAGTVRARFYKILSHEEMAEAEEARKPLPRPARRAEQLDLPMAAAA